MSMVNKYSPAVTQREENLFQEEYYSGSDVKVFFDDNKQTEIGYISYSVSEQLKPIYGYSSRTFDDVAVGNRIVTGMIKVPIKNQDENTSIEEITKVPLTTKEEIDNRNSQEQKRKDNIEWINNAKNNRIDRIHDKAESNMINDVQKKLIKLGYQSTLSGLLDSATKTIIALFQKANQLPSTNYLNQDTINEIDKQVALLENNVGTVDEQVNMYYGPSEAMSVLYQVKANEKIYILQDVGNGFSLVRTMDGREGYMRTSQIREVVV